MPVRTIIDIPVSLHDELRQRAESSGTSIQSLIVRALGEAYASTGKREPVTGTLVSGKGKLGPCFPTDATPHDLILS
jgi:hypothetical protein